MLKGRKAPGRTPHAIRCRHHRRGAGATFARRLAQQSPGLKILLLDAQDEGHKKPCGGLLAPDAQKTLAHFDLVLPKSVLADPQIFAVETMDLRTRRVRYYQRYYLNMDRYAFDRWLVSLVPPTVEIVRGAARPCRERTGASSSPCGRRRARSFACRCLIGADGARSIVRETFFDPTIYRYMSLQQWFRATDKAFPFYSCIFDPETSESCSWLMHKDGFVIYGGCFEKDELPRGVRTAEARLADFLGHDFGELAKTEACLADRPRHWRDFVIGADGVYLIGEAAGFHQRQLVRGASRAPSAAAARWPTHSGT